MSDVTFTGERLHAGDRRFALDIARHRAAYEVARCHAGGGRVLDLGCGSGYGTALLAAGAARVVGVDRVRPDGTGGRGGGHFLLGDLRAIPLAAGSFDLVVSFQVIEHLENPSFYVDALAELMRPEGLTLVTTPNILMSDGVNPYHVHEYTADELAVCLGRRFEQVELRGIRPTENLRRVFEQRSRRIRRIMKLDPLRLRERLPRPLVEWLFAQFALLVRHANQQPAATEPIASWSDFPVGPAADDCLDLLAFCRKPR
jgi:2-polyprenyl-3-methyl-5-hydroxy-6-metoxy-1,4-benzoquinol methylase